MGAVVHFLFLDIHSWTHRLASNRGEFCISLYTLDLLFFFNLYRYINCFVQGFNFFK